MTSIDQQHSDPSDTWMIEVDGQLVPDYDRTLSNFNEGDVVSGWRNKLQTAMANVTPASMLAEQHRKKAEPGSGEK